MKSGRFKISYNLNQHVDKEQEAPQRLKNGDS